MGCFYGIHKVKANWAFSGRLMDFVSQGFGTFWLQQKNVFSLNYIFLMINNKLNQFFQRNACPGDGILYIIAVYTGGK